MKSDSGLMGPDIELIFAPMPFLDHGDTEPDGHGYTIGAVLLQPESRGTIRLASSDPSADPLIDPRYLSAARDTETLLWGFEKAMEIFGTEPLASYVTVPIRPEITPDSREDRMAALRRWSETLYHPAGTCSMGVGDDAVVDSALKVRGIAGLRVADASVMPTLNRGHTHAPTVMIGEKASDLILSAT